jgi:hypothetical protein
MPWELQDVPFKFQLSDWTFFKLKRRMQVRRAGLEEEPTALNEILDSYPGELATRSQGFLIRNLPVDSTLDVVKKTSKALLYVPYQYPHYYIEMGTPFVDYTQNFSSKTRSTLKRKVRKFAEKSGGEIDWRTYKSPDQLPEFFQSAQEVSSLTYQHRLFDGGLPNSEEFRHEAEALARDDKLRAYVMFYQGEPVSYLYCPVESRVLIYEYLGYKPDYSRDSVGTVLQWLALEQLFEENRFLYFDFTEGQSEHKRLFATTSRQSANVYWLKPTIVNSLLVRTHLWMDGFSAYLGGLSERLGLKAKLKRFIRR